MPNMFLRLARSEWAVPSGMNQDVIRTIGHAGQTPPSIHTIHFHTIHFHTMHFHTTQSTIEF